METQKPTPNPDEMPLSAEEIKAIGEIELGPAKHEVFLNNHYKKLIAGGIVLMVLASAAIGYYSYKTEQKAHAGALVVQAMNSASAAGAVEPEQYDAAALAQITKDFADTPSADTARFMEALALIADPARTESGLATLQELASNSANELLRARALASLANYYMAKEENDKAVGYWKQVVAMGDNPYKAIAYINLGDLAKVAGDIEGARQYYTLVSAECATSPLVREKVAAMRLALLEVDAPKPVAAPEPAPAAPAVENPFGIDTANPFGDSQPAAPADSTTEPFGGMSTMPGGLN